MNINHSAEYLALWKSRKRAEWEAVRLDQEASALRGGSGGGTEAGPGRATEDSETTVGVLAGAAVATGRDDGLTVDQLEEESRRWWGLCAELGAELDRVETALTPEQRKNAEKVLKQWEREEQARGG